MYRFTQEGEFSEWLIRPDKSQHEPWKVAKDCKASRITVLALSGDPDITEATELRYAGPLMFDIDSDKGDLEGALESGVELCKKLIEMGVQEHDIEINLSGSKGLHIYIDQRVFSSGRPLKGLPAIYKRMAVELYVPHVDFAVYSAGKGRMVRPPNSKRPDGAYKVPVSFEQLKEVTAETYKKLVSKPAPYEKAHTGDNIKCPNMVTLFNLVKAAADYDKDKFVVIPDEVLSKLEDNIPPCVELLANGQERDNTAFNRAALNFSKWAARSQVDPVRMDSLLTRISEETTSNKYNTPTSRKRHIQGLIQYVNGNDKYKFSCVGMLTVVKGHPCKDCPIKDENGIATIDDAIFNNMFVHANMGQYYADPDFTKVIASFNMDMGCPIIGEGSFKIEAAQVTITAPLSGETYKIPDFSEEAWVSKQAFKKEIQGLEGVAFFGTDNHVSMLRLTIHKQALMRPGEMDPKYKHSKAGLYYYKTRGPLDVRDPDHRGTMVYVENGFSVDSRMWCDTHLLTSYIPCAPEIKTRYKNKITEEANEVFDLMLRTNSPTVISTMLGWLFATHLKQHFMKIEKRFPLLYISGMAGTGKNSLVALWLRLCALEGEAAQFTLEAPNSTKLPFQQGLSNSTTIPRVINEFNKKSMANAQYGVITELLKGAFDEQVIAKGRLGGGDRNGANVSTVNWSITAPVITLSEEPIVVPALLHRGIKVELDPRGHAEGSEAFYKCEYRADKVASIGTYLINCAVQTPIKDILAYTEAVNLPQSIVESNIPDRLKYGYKVLLASYAWGYDMLSMEGSGMSQDNLLNVLEMKNNLMSHLSEYSHQIEKSSSVNEVDRIMKDFAILANFDNDAKAHHSLSMGKHFAVADGRLYLDIIMAYPVLKSFKRSAGDPIAIVSDEAFVNSAKGLPYFVSSTTPCPFLIGTDGRGVCEFDMKGMARAGIPTQLFGTEV